MPIFILRTTSEKIFHVCIKFFILHEIIRISDNLFGGGGMSKLSLKNLDLRRMNISYNYRYKYYDNLVFPLYSLVKEQQ